MPPRKKRGRLAGAGRCQSHHRAHRTPPAAGDSRRPPRRRHTHPRTAVRNPRSPRPLHLQPRRVHHNVLTGASESNPPDLLRFLHEDLRRSCRHRSSRTSTSSATARLSVISSALPVRWTPWSWASRRFSARSSSSTPPPVRSEPSPLRWNRSCSGPSRSLSAYAPRPSRQLLRLHRVGRRRPRPHPLR